MATITFHANNNDIFPSNPSNPPDLIHHTAESGLGFFGGGFGISVPVGSYQTSTYVTNANGTASGIRCSNLKYDDTTLYPNRGVQIQGNATVGTSGVPNIAAPLNIRFEHDEGVRVQNCKLRIFDRRNISNHATEVTTQVYEVRHPHPVEGVNFGANNGPLRHRGVPGDHEWVTFTEDGDAMTDMILTPGPGPSGLNTSADEILATGDGTYTNWISNEGESYRSTRHDWYIGISASPDGIGSKTEFGLYFTLEYL
jgi:hypothetical protein